MKKLIAIALSLFAGIAAFAQFEPSTTWPYVYKDFTKGTLKMPSGTEKTALFNVHLAHSTLHFIDGNMIKQAANTDIFSVQIGNDFYMNADGRMMQVVAKSDKGMVVLGKEIDIAALNSTTAAYGSGGTTLGNMSLSSLENIGVGNGIVNNNLMDGGDKESGKTLPLIEKYYIIVNGNVIYATKKDVGEYIGEAQLKAFLKINKVKWSNPQTLLPLVDFLADNK